MPLHLNSRRSTSYPARLKELVAGLRTGAIKPHNLDPIEIYAINGRIVTADNRRLVAARLAGVKVRFKIRRNPYTRDIRKKVD